MRKKATIEGMTCGHCVASVTKALEAVDGVTGVNVELEKNVAEVEADEEISDEAISNAVKSAGYNVTSIDQEG